MTGRAPSRGPARGRRRGRRIVLGPGRGGGAYWADLWHHRELFVILTWRDVAIRYKQTVIGVLWALIRPLVAMAVFTVIFGRVADLPSEGSVPYPLLVLAGMLPWLLVSAIVDQGARSVVDNAALVEKVYFPRLLIPGAAAGVALVDFVVGLALLFALMAVWGALPGWQAIFLPFVVLLAVLAGLGPAFLLAALNVRYRDVRHAIPFMVQVGLYVSPVGFSSAVVPDEWRLLYGLNPVAGIIDAFRWCVFGGETAVHLPGLLLGLAAIAATLAVGIVWFRRAEKTFADVI